MSLLIKILKKWKCICAIINTHRGRVFTCTGALAHSAPVCSDSLWFTFNTKFFSEGPTDAHVHDWHSVGVMGKHTCVSFLCGTAVHCRDTSTSLALLAQRLSFISTKLAQGTFNFNGLIWHAFPVLNSTCMSSKFPSSVAASVKARSRSETAWHTFLWW